MIPPTEFRRGDWGMKPSKVIAFEERRLGRPLTEEERNAVLAARDECHDGKRATTKAMRAVLSRKRRTKASED